MDDAALEVAMQLGRRAAQVRATAAARIGVVPVSEHEDIEQEGLLACWRALPQFDASRASIRTFVEHVVASRLTTLDRARRCRPRLHPFDEDSHQTGNAWAHEIELRSDVQRALNGLSKTDRQVALALIGHTPTEVSRRLGVARSTVYERIRHIRTQLVDAGLRPHGATRS